MSTAPPADARFADSFDDAFGENDGRVSRPAPPLLGAAALHGLTQLGAVGVAVPLACGAAPAALAIGATLAGIVALLCAARVARPAAEPTIVLTAAVAAALLAVTGEPSLALLLHSSAVLLGALVPGRRLALALPLVATLLVAGLWSLLRAEQVVVHAVFFMGFGALGRGLFFATLAFVRKREQSRVDAELLRIAEDARLLRLVGADVHAGSGGHAGARLMAHTLAARDACYRLLDLGATALNADGAALYLWDEHKKSLILKEQRVDGDSMPRTQLGAHSGVAGLAFTKSTAVRVFDERGAQVRAHRDRAVSALAVPVIERGRPFGVAIFDRERAVPFGAQDEQVARALVDQLQTALDTERVLGTLDDERRRVARVLDAARAFSGVVRLDQALDQIAAVAAELMPRAAHAVITVERSAEAHAPPQLCVARVRDASGARLALPEQARLPIDAESWLGRALAQREALPHTHLTDAPVHGLCATHDALLRDAGDLFVLPLIGQGEIGALLVITTPRGSRLSDDEKSALRALADLAGVALAGARLFFLVEQRATTDGLTGLVNRRTLDEKLTEAVARARRSGAPLALVLTDVDHFKKVNDTYGHGAGDDVLKGVSAALRHTARTSDVVARYGGEEFVLVLEGTDAAGAVQLAERARLAVKGLTFATEKGPLSVTSSFGVALLQPGNDGAALLERADQHLYRAKQAGRDRVVI